MFFAYRKWTLFMIQWTLFMIQQYLVLKFCVHLETFALETYEILQSFVCQKGFTKISISTQKVMFRLHSNVLQVRPLLQLWMFLTQLTLSDKTNITVVIVQDYN